MATAITKPQPESEPAARQEGANSGPEPGRNQDSSPIVSTADPPQPVPELLTNRRILIVDDNLAIHDDFRKVLGGVSAPKRGLLEAEAALFGGNSPAPIPGLTFDLDSAHQGREALEKVRLARAAGKPFALAFVDMRMPPGWDGIETIVHLWKADPELQVVICTAYSDYSWSEISARLGISNSLVVLKKPFDNVEVLQLAHAFTRKWELNREAQLKLGELTGMVAQRTRELEAANQQLKREGDERVLLERQFRQAQKMEAIGQLAAGVAHDFNNILTVIHGHASMLAMRLGEQGPHARSLAEIRNSADRAANLVRQLLTFSRKQIMQFRNVDLGEVLPSVSGMLRELVGEHIVVETDCAAGLPLIYADRGMMEQVVMNLAVNARDAMGHGGRLALGSSPVTVTAEMAKGNRDARPGLFARLTVSDTGCGINPEALAHLFEPFFTTKEVGKGTGLGLATVYGIVKQHQGWIEVQSQPGAGTTFHIYFPPAAATSPPPPEPKPETPSPHGTETILVAEDEPTLREMVSDILTQHGYHVLEASSGPAALEVWRREHTRIDLLLTDMVMPGGMMGTDLAEELHRNNPALKVIYTTGYSPGSTGLQDAISKGINLLPKPFSPNALAQYVRECLDAKGKGRNVVRET
jgi:two-component system NtrC family sensor kinase